MIYKNTENNYISIEEYIYYMYNTLYMFDTQHKLNWVQQVIWTKKYIVIFKVCI